MDATVARGFRDRLTWRAYRPGDEYSGDGSRVRELREGGYLEADAPPGAAEDVSTLSVAQLRALCEERGIDAPKKATKAQLTALLGG